MAQETHEIELSAPQHRVLSALAERILFMAGVGSGKSHVIALLAADVILNNPELIQFIGANTYGQLTKSTLKRVFEVWQQLFSWQNGKDFVIDKIPPKHFTRLHEDLKSYENTISFANGALIFVASLDNYKVIDGTEFAIAYLDETKDTKEEAVKEVITARLRQPGLLVDSEGRVYNSDNLQAKLAAGNWTKTTEKDLPVIRDKNGAIVRSWNPLYIFTSPAKVPWLADWFKLTDNAAQITARIFSATDFYEYEDNEIAVVVSSTYHNAHNLPSGYIPKLLNSYAGNQNLIDMLIYGSPVAKEGGEIVPTFKRLEHVKPVTFSSELPYHLTFDFNVVPYMPALVAQLQKVGERWVLRIGKEYALEHPRNKTAYICEDFKKDFGEQCKALYYYGDPSGRSRNTVSMDYTDNFDAISKLLKQYLNNNSDRVPRAHPALLKSGNFLVALFTGKLGIDIEIDPSCKHLLRDLEYSKEDPNGGILKEVTTDPTTKKRYQKNGHFYDALRYLVVMLFAKMYEKYPG
jgi:hypothetical protein